MESLRIRDHCIDRIAKKEESSRKSIESIGDIHTIGGRDQYEDEKGNIPYADINTTEKRNMEGRISELRIEPIGSYKGKKDEECHLESCRESFGPSDLSDIEVVIENANTADTHEGEEGDIGLIAIPETVLEASSENGLDPGSHILDDEREECHEYHCDDDEYPSHSWRS